MAAKPSLTRHMLCLRCRIVHEARTRSPAAHRPLRLAPTSLFQHDGWTRKAVGLVYAAGAGVPARPFHSGPVRWADSALVARRHDDDIDDGDVVAAETDGGAVDAEEIWNSLLSEDNTPTDDEVMRHIDELRPADETTLPQSEFQRRADTLAGGFTAAQLQAYIRKNTVSVTSQPTVYAWEVRRRPWVPQGSADDEQQGGHTKKLQQQQQQQPNNILLRGYVTPDMTNKERLAVQVLRGCWGLAVRERMDEPGHVDVVVRPLDFALLEAGASTWLRALSAAFSRVVTATATTSRSRSRSHSRSQTRQLRRIAVLPGQRTLRVFAPQATADAILAEIDAKLKTARTRRFSLNTFSLATAGAKEESSADDDGEDQAWIREAHATAAAEAKMADEGTVSLDMAGPAVVERKPDFREVLKANIDLLRALSELTGSWVRVEDDAVCVSWVDDASLAAEDGTTTSADVGDTVFRLLLRAAHDWRATKDGSVAARLDHQAPPQATAKGRFLAETDDAAAAGRARLPWHHRVGRWARWLEPAPSDSLVARQRFAVKSPMPAALPLEFATADNAVSGEAVAEENRRVWFRRSLVSTVATFGRVLHAQPADGDQILSPPPSSKGTTAPLASTDRILVPEMPPLLGMKLGQDALSTPAPTDAGSTPACPVVTSTTIRLFLLPRPTTCAPSLEVLLDVPAGEADVAGTGSQAGQPVFAELRVIQATSVCDTLFPTEPVDVRLTQTRYAALTAAELGNSTTHGENTDVTAVLQFIDQSRPYLQAVLGVDTATGHTAAANKTAKKAGAAAATASAVDLGLPAAVGEIQLPQHVLHLKGLGTRAQQRRRADGYRPVALAYVLAGLEVRRRVATAYEGWTLSLTSVDGGPDGGRRTELTLEAVPADMTTSTAAVATDKQSFRAAVGAVATGRDIHWTLPLRAVV